LHAAEEIESSITGKEGTLMRVMKSTLSAISLYAAGLFVDPPPGSVLANYGLDSLRFVKPVEPGDTIKVRLTSRRSTPAATSSAK
jgi:acyl dehydratase